MELNCETIIVNATKKKYEKDRDTYFFKLIYQSKFSAEHLENGFVIIFFLFVCLFFLFVVVILKSAEEKKNMASKRLYCMHVI